MTRLPCSDVAITRTAGALANLYWDLAEEMRQAAVVLSTAIGPGSALPVVDNERLARAMQAGLILRYQADRK